jgi:hypothetical protein
VNGGYDAVDVAGIIDYTGGSLILSFQNGSAFSDGTTFNLLSFTSQTGSLTAVTASGFYGGAGISLVNNSGVWSAAAVGQTLSFDQGSGELSFTAVPEPGSLSLLAFGGLTILRRRRR